jgi:hypothetical protein
MSTSLDVQAIDSKVDNFAAKQVCSHRITVNHLEKIEESVQAIGTLQHATHETTLDISRSTDKIHETLQDIWMSQTSSEQTTRIQVEKLDATLAAIQRSLLNVARRGKARPRARRTGRRICHDSSQVRPVENCKDGSMTETFSEFVQRTTDNSVIPAQLNRLVDLAVTVRYRRGKAHYEAVAVPDLEFSAADSGAKLRMVKYLQDLRLLLWLLC